MTIKHLVISGGGPLLFKFLGIVQQLEKDQVYCVDNLQSIFATSAGTITAVIICLKYDWATVNTYMIDRPWNELYTINIEMLFKMYNKCGIFDYEVMKKTLKPLLDAKDIPLNITLLEFYQYIPIELHFFAVDIHLFEIEDFSYLTHPDLELLTAIHMSCALPLFFTPQTYNNKCYIDGGILCNYPIEYCLRKFPKESEILGIKIQIHSNTNSDSSNNDNTTIIEYFMKIIHGILYSLSNSTILPTISHEISLKESFMSLKSITNVLHDGTIRSNMIENGIEIAKEYYKTVLINDSILDDVAFASNSMI